MTTYRLIAPNGRAIVGTPETILGLARANTFTEDDSGQLIPDYSGDTDMYWDSTETQTTETGEMMVQDDDGATWPISACTREPE